MDDLEQIAVSCGWTVAQNDGKELVLSCASKVPVTCTLSVVGDGTVSFSITSALVLSILTTQFPSVQFDAVNVSYELPQLLRSALFLCMKLGNDTVAEYKAQTTVETQKDEGSLSFRQTKEKVGIDVHTRALSRYWKDTCALTGLKVRSLLLGTYAKPWDSCESDKERMDACNGFLMEARYARLFESGYITFDSKGNMQVSSKLSDEAKAILSIDPSLKLRKVERAHQKYLSWHRDNLFQS
jgi:hypothetical protein